MSPSSTPDPRDPAAAPARLQIVPIPAFRDNYIWLLQSAGHAAVVDPGDAAPVSQVLQQRGLILDAIVVTHHHADHVGGVAALAKASSARVYGPADSPFTGAEVQLRDGDRITVLGQSFDVLAVPGHTLDHIAYWSATLGVLFCGDTLFACGCGRLFEGTAAQMYSSLSRILALPPSTLTYCAHEYTAANIRFALAVEPANEALVQRSASCSAMRAHGQPTVPSTLALEAATNPFLRCEVGPVRAAAARRVPGLDNRGESVFAALRSWKDSF